MKTEVIAFDFEGKSVRSLKKDGEDWFVARDVAEALEYKRPSDAVRVHCKGVGEMETPTKGGVQKIKVIQEPDMYRLIIRSKLPSAERFERWVFEEVLPRIRKHGGYISGEEEVESEDELVYRAMTVLQKKVEDMQKKVKEDAPKVDWYEGFVSTDDSVTVTTLAKTLGTTAVKLNKWFREMEIKFKDLDLPRAGYEDCFKIIPFYTNTGKVVENVRVTPKGIIRLSKKYQEHFGEKE